VKFSAADPPNAGVADGTLADGNDSKLDGPCEVCHTLTKYHTNTGDGTNHFDGTNCLQCHQHFTTDIVNYFWPTFIGTQSHVTHFTDPKGPLLGESPDCTVCHYPPDFSKFGPSGDSLDDTDVCDECHSPGGAFDGVGKTGPDTDPDYPKWVAYGAKFNWADGIYTEDGDALKAGKEDWCGGCHDDVPSIVDSGATPATDPVPAPNVMGDNAQTYGYNVNGHGGNPSNKVYCSDCHDLTVLHIDGKPRTYEAALDNWQEGYRLDTPMDIPRIDTYGQNAFRLCYKGCHHLYTDQFSFFTNFRDDRYSEGYNFHEIHLDETFVQGPEGIVFDSDFDGQNCGPGQGGQCADSAITCTACHNVHGSPSAKMTRHGELIRPPDTIPALDFIWYKNDKTTPTLVFDDSRWGSMLCGRTYNLDYNHVCFGCHDTGRIDYWRVPGAGVGLSVHQVWTSDPSDPQGDPKTSFNRGDPIRYHVTFTVSGPTSQNYYLETGKAKVTDSTGTKLYNLDKNAFLTPNQAPYEWTWDDKTVPAGAATGTAKAVVQVQMFDQSGGNLIMSRKKVWKFQIH
jgi:hypothetical protein